MSFTLCSEQEAINKAGLNANSAVTASSSILSAWSDEAESTACAIARSDVVTNFGSLTANGKEVLKQYCSAFVAQAIINYDMSGYTSRQEALTMLNVLENKMDKSVSLIKEDKNKKYMGIT